MIKVFIPEAKGKVKTNVRGFWYSQDTKKTYYDYLRVDNIKDSFFGLCYIKGLKVKYNQECITFIENNKLNIFYNFNRIEVLQNRIYKEVARGNLKAEIKEALKVYGGITIYKEGNKYFKEIFY